MEIKTTEEISVEDYTKVANKKWVAYDNMIKVIKKIQKDRGSHKCKRILAALEDGEKE